MKDDLIRRQDAINCEFHVKIINDIEYVMLSEVQMKIRKLPSAPPDIIRCKDCKHWDKTWTNDWAKDYHYCPMVESVRKVDFYCADAERRKE